MSREEIIEKVEQHLKQGLAGQESEDIKFDFKAKWYNLNEEAEINEFLKDATSIANTFGWDGFIVIGFDEKKKEFHQSVFSDCGLKDTTEIYNLLIKKLSTAFDINIYDIVIEENKLSVIHIPPAIEKPFVIKEYKKIDNNGSLKSTVQNRIFVRKGTGTFPASKYDIDLMYYDKKNILPEYSIEINIIELRIKNTDYKLQSSPVAQCRLSIENMGKRSLCIRQIELIPERDDWVSGASLIGILHWDKNRQEYISSKIVVPNGIQFFIIDLMNSKPFPDAKDDIINWNQPWMNWVVKLSLTNGKSIIQKIKVHADLQVKRKF